MTSIAVAIGVNWKSSEKMNFEKLKNSELPKTIDKNSGVRSFEKGTPIDRIVTEMGSEYKYLPDGRTQRFKKVENKNEEPQDAIVFVPNYEWIQKNAPQEHLRKNIFGENEAQYEQIILEYIQKKKGIENEGKKVYIIDEKGYKLDTNEEISRTGEKIFLWFGKETDNDKHVEDFRIPVTARPTIGYYAFDTSKYKDKSQWMREKHLGNKVIKIVIK